MNDRFKFRGITKGKVNEFVYGSLLWYAGEPQIWDKDGKNYIVKPKTVQQCTGLKDKNGKLIYEGDIVKIGNGSVNGSVIETKREVKWTINTWNVPTWVVDKPDFSHYVEVIGNIYENKSLLESEG